MIKTQVMESVVRMIVKGYWLSLLVLEVVILLEMYALPYVVMVKLFGLRIVMMGQMITLAVL